MGSWSGSAVGFSEPGGVSEGVSAAQVPPEVWQRLLWAYQGWLRRHEGLARVLLRLTRVCQRITFVLMVVLSGRALGGGGGTADPGGGRVGRRKGER